MAAGVGEPQRNSVIMFDVRLRLRRKKSLQPLFRQAVCPRRFKRRELAAIVNELNKIASAKNMFNTLSETLVFT